MSTMLVLIFIIVGTGFGQHEKPKNIILFISDGCGYNHIIATDYYQYGKEDSQVYEKFPFISSMSTYPYDWTYDTKKAWEDFEYLMEKYTDSAAAATAMSTGVKTFSGAICVGPNLSKLKTVLEIAEEKGKSTGVISTVMFSHATPAGFVAHNVSRSNYKKIAREMLINSKVEVIMGCGHPWYNHNGEKVNLDENQIQDSNQEHKKNGNEIEYKYVGGKDIWEELLKGTVGNDCDYDGKIEYWKLIQKKQEFLNLAQGETPERVLGIPEVGQTLQYNRLGNEAEPFQIPLNKNVPNLVEMTRAGLNVLDNNKNGFFLMVEGGAVDWAAHNNNSARLIEEEIDFNQSVEAAVEWVEKKSSWEETLIIVTADHECGYLNGPESGGKRISSEPIEKVWKPIENNGKGKIPVMEWYSGSHTNSLVPIFAQGTGWELLKREADEDDLRFGKYLDNAELGKVLLYLLK